MPPNGEGLLAADEPIARYCSQSSHYTASTGRVKPSAVLPPPLDLRTSTFRILGLNNDDIWALGDNVLAGSGKPLLARAETIVRIVETVGLQVDPDNNPPRHAHIVGWPPDKEAQRELAVELAKRMTLVIR